MKNFISTIVVIAVLAAGIFLYLRNADVDVNYERFNLVAPGVLRTPAERFNNIVDYPFKENYLIIGDTRIHYLDEGPEDGEIIYLLLINIINDKLVNIIRIIVNLILLKYIIHL